jgi:N-acetylmuramoyl-L-alanine amidase
MLALANVGHFVEPLPIGGGKVLKVGDSGQAVEELQSMLEFYGYGVEITGNFDAATEVVVAAFQRHFRPERIDGIADASTVETLRLLLSSLHISFAQV